MFTRNLPSWIVFKLIRGQAKNLPMLLSRKTKTVVRRLRSVLSDSPARQTWPEPEEIWELSTMPSSERALWQSHLSAFYTYVPGDYGGRIEVFRAKVRPLLHSLEPDLGWSKINVGQVDVHHVPGDHKYIMHEPVCSLLAEKLSGMVGGWEDGCESSCV